MKYGTFHRLVMVAFIVALAVVVETSPILGESARVIMVAGATDYARAYTNMGREQLRNGNYLRAVRLLNTAIAKGADAPAFKLRGEAYSRLGKLDKALADLNHYTASRPKDPSGYILRGRCRNELQQYAQAYQDYSSALRLEPSNVKALLGRGIAGTALEIYDQAIQDFQKLLSIQPQNQDALVNLGFALLLSQNDVKAIEVLKKARESEIDDYWKQKLDLSIEALSQSEGMRKGQEKQSVSAAPEDRIPPSDQAESDSALPSSSVGREGRESAGKDSDGDAQHSVKVPPDSSPKGRQSLMERLRGSDLFGGSPDAIKNLSGRWETTYLGARIGLDVKHRGGKRIGGVLRIRDPMGREDTYHFSGTFERGNVYAHHHSGHLFRGRLTSTGRLVGSLRLKNGRTVRVNLTAQ